MTRLFYSLEEDDKNAIKYLEINNLDKDRPFGLSGHLRVKNEARTIKECIISSLPFLDELIITLQPSDDGTEEIIKELHRAHSKIRLFYYTQRVVPSQFSHINKNESLDILEKFNNNIPSNSVHSLAHYYNFGLVKIKYKYYMKIDADQIYLTDKLLSIKEGIRQAHIENKKFLAHLKRFAKKCRNRIYRTCVKTKIIKNKIEFKDLTKDIILNQITLKTKEKFMMYPNAYFTLQGINLGMPKDKSDNKNYKQASNLRLYPYKNLAKTFIPLTKNSNYQSLNGQGDTAITSPKSINIYLRMRDREVEYFNTSKLETIHGVGICWMHYGLEKRGITLDGEEGIDYISLGELLNKNPEEIFDTLNATEYTKDGIREYFNSDFILLKDFLES